MEKRLIERCKAGDISAFEAVFERYGQKLFGLCLRMSGRKEDAEDLLQEVFVILLTKIKGFRGEAKFSTWLYRVAVNTCLNHIRKSKRVGLFIAADEEPQGEAGVGLEPTVQRTALKRAITGLPTGYRTAVILHDLQGFNHREIAEIMGITEGASKSQLFKARKKLKEMLQYSEPRAVDAAGAEKQVRK
jgi:RNA polymerase sigma-70 factor (ECF subfamily)